MPPQQPTPRPLGQKDAAVLIGLLAVIESELAGKNVEPYLVTALIRRFQHEGLIPKKAGSPDLRVVLAELNQRLRVAHGEPIELGELDDVELADEELDEEVAPEPAPVPSAAPETAAAPDDAAAEEPAADEPTPDTETAEQKTAADQTPADRTAEEEPAGVPVPEPPRQLWRKPTIAD